MKNSSKLLVAMGVGALAGAVLGILFAPDKGSVTRERISDTAKDVAGTVKNMKDKVARKMKASPDGRMHAEKEMQAEGA
jgi:gas vesicle protein